MNLVMSIQDRQKRSKKRLNICKACEKYDSLFGRCKECGCFMILKVKFSKTKCPLNKWDEDTQAWDEIELP